MGEACSRRASPDGISEDAARSFLAQVNGSDKNVFAGTAVQASSSAVCRGKAKAGETQSLPALPQDDELIQCIAQARQLEKRKLSNLAEGDAVIKKHFGPQASLSKMESVHGLMVFVLDNVLPEPERERLYNGMLSGKFRRTEFARPDTREFRHHVVEYNVEKLRSTQLYKIVDDAVRIVLPKPQKAYRIYTNAVMFGDVAFVHRDCNDHDHATAIVYPNPTWSSELGGETVYYDNAGDIVTAVEPRPGRLAIFHGNILHKGSPPSRLFWGSRFTTAFKFAPPDEDDFKPPTMG
eukprot:TRINITY_DN24124_c0_g1_i1.p1 TRINITY_DN24124_c0_g1~~TRINITY_DN24124_c0_g1_i1.p1  ORF type:complete len:294 (+),score=74.69 TRINITY_DN24124_c0_g1_i1:62-943(+)